MQGPETFSKNRTGWRQVRR